MAFLSNKKAEENTVAADSTPNGLQEAAMRRYREFDGRIAVFLNKTAQTFAFGSHNNGDFAVLIDFIDCRIGIAVHTDYPETVFFQSFNGAAEVGYAGDGDEFDGSCGCFVHGAGFKRRILVLDNQAECFERGAGTDNRADVLRVGYLVKN